MEYQREEDRKLNGKKEERKEENVVLKAKEKDDGLILWRCHFL